MTDEVYCGLALFGDKETPCGIAFLSDSVDTFSETDDEEILELVEEHRPAIIAFSTPLRGPVKEKGFNEDEEELVDEGHSFLPRSMMDKKELERAVFLKNSIKRLGITPDFIECRPLVTSDVLDVNGDEDLEDLGVTTGAIHNTQEFDAVLAAITAKFYANDQYEEKGFIVPKEME